MAPTFRFVSHGEEVGTSLTVPKPTGTTQDDILYCFINGGEGNATADPTTVPTDWTLLDARATNTQATCWLYRKVAGGSEPADYTWSGFQTSNDHSGHMVAVLGADTAIPEDAVDVVANAGLGANISASLTSAGTDRYWLQFGGGDVVAGVAWSSTDLPNERHDDIHLTFNPNGVFDDQVGSGALTKVIALSDATFMLIGAAVIVRPATLLDPALITAVSAFSIEVIEPIPFYPWEHRLDQVEHLAPPFVEPAIGQRRIIIKNQASRRSSRW